ncbi:amidohydrolase [Leptospira montravelensis]|uniref:Amidohydrolase n=2 Tax=Leptospiraceae TaxID=170 RepID=A0ABY2LX69_9LEPT|nr:amidohydrolase [Leptospira montravelensis]TGL06306.1 amidohydrolase [Leptospira montravelensis]
MKLMSKLRTLVLIFLFTVSIGGKNTEKADFIYYNGTILTVNDLDEIVEAIAIRDGILIAVGTKKEVFEHQDKNTILHDLEGKTLLPGFIASHEHPTLSALFSGMVDVSGFKNKSNEEVWGSLREAVKKTPKGEWIYAMGLDPALVPDLQIPTRKKLDELSVDHPIFIIAQSIHSFWANTKAFEEIGLSRSSKDPGNGSYYERDSEGDFTGYIVESAAAGPFLERLKSPLRIYNRYTLTLDNLLHSGFTSVASLGYNVPPLFAKIAASKNFKPRIRQFFYLVKDELKYLPGKPDSSDPYFQILGIKLWHDGSPYMGGMYLDDPYLNNSLTEKMGIAPGSNGNSHLTELEIIDLAKKYSDLGWQVSVHAQGDKSNREVLTALSKVESVTSKLPFRVEHCLLLPIENLPTMKKNRITPSFHINHLYYYGDVLQDSLLGETRANLILPVKSSFMNNLYPTLHADSPMFPADAFSLMQTAITRKTKSGRILGAKEAITNREAIRAMTVNGAYQIGMKDKLGSLEVGKWADMVILDKNPYDTRGEDFHKIQIQKVLLNGEEAK